MDEIIRIQDIIQISKDLPIHQREKFLKLKSESFIQELNEFISYLESENIELRLTILSREEQNEFPYKVDGVISRLLKRL
jgi:hypothetical protein